MLIRRFEKVSVCVWIKREIGTSRQRKADSREWARARASTRA
jgi:hypothetical protein